MSPSETAAPPTDLERSFAAMVAKLDQLLAAESDPRQAFALAAVARELSRKLFNYCAHRYWQSRWHVPVEDREQEEQPCALETETNS